MAESVEFHAKKIMGAKNIDASAKHIDALKEMRTSEAVDALIQGIYHRTNYDIGVSCINALVETKFTKVIPALVDALNHERSRIVDASSAALVKIGKPTIPYLIKDLKENEGYAYALYKIGAPAVNPLIESLGGKDANISSNSAGILGLIGDKRAVPALLKALERDDKDLLRNSVEALGRIKGEADNRVIKRVTGFLSHDDPEVVLRSVIMLGNKGDRKALSHLMKLTGGPDEAFNNLVKQTIKRIQAREKHA